MNLNFLIKKYAKYRYKQLEKKNIVETQKKILFNLLKKSSNTKFGKDHNFKSIRTLADYQKNIPLRTYDNFWNEYWKKDFPTLKNCTYKGTVPYFAVTSGTSLGVTKYIPLTKEMLKSNVKAGLDLLTWHFLNNPTSTLLKGKSFLLGGSTDLIKEAKKIYSGDLSGITTANIPWWLKKNYFPDKKTSLIKDWEEKINILSKMTLKEDIRLISGVPNWILIFMNKYKEIFPNKELLFKNIFPKLEMIVHGGVNFSSYYDIFKNLLKESNAELREVYPASEGFIAVQDKATNEGLRMILDNNIFYEFIPIEELNSKNPTIHFIGNIKKNINYAIIMTTCAGLWRYVIGDTIKFIDLNPPRLLITGRVSYYLSSFGEHLILGEIEDALSYASKSIDKQILDYSVGSVFPKNISEIGCHLYIVEFKGEIPLKNMLHIFATKIDERLCQRNEDYKSHRANGYGLNSPIIEVVKEGTFSRWMASRNKLGGQNKVPRIITDEKLFDSLKTFINYKVD